MKFTDGNEAVESVDKDGGTNVYFSIEAKNKLQIFISSQTKSFSYWNIWNQEI